MSDQPGALAHRPMGHLASLEGLRGVAILVVVLVHLYSPIFSGGNSGVDIFFVLSGFLITKLAYEEHQRSNDFSLGNFYIRRVFRIFPALYALLAVLLLASFTFLSDIGPNVRMNIVFAAFSIGNLWPLFRGFEVRQALGHTWSLGMEEQFYLVWPFVLAVVPMAFRQARRFAVWVLACAAASVLIGRILVIGVLHYPHWGAIPLLNFDGLALGCALAIYVHHDDAGSSRRFPQWAALAGMSFIVIDLFASRFYTGHDPYMIRTLLLRVAASAVVLLLVARPTNVLTPLLDNRPLRFLGRISYSLYLWHLPVFLVFATERHPTVPRAVLVPVKLAVSFAAAMASYRYLEQPMLRRGRRVLAAKQQRAVTIATEGAS